MKIAIKNNKTELNEIITKGKIDVISQNAERKKKIDYFIEIGLLKDDTKNNYIIYNPYSETTKYPNVEKALEFLIKIYTNNEINQENPFEDLDTLEGNLKTYEDLKKRNILPDEIKNKSINKFTYLELKNTILQYTGQGENAKVSLSAVTKMGRDSKMEELPNIKSPFKVVKVNDVTTAMNLAKGSQWCVADVYHAKAYLTNNPERGPLYFVYENDKQYALFSFGSNPGRGELMLPDDSRITGLAMQKVKDHWSNLLDYLHAFNIHEYDVDYSAFSKSLENYLNSVDEIPDPPSFKFAEILQYSDENVMNFFTQRNASSLEKDQDSYGKVISKINQLDSKELTKSILAIVKSQILKSVDQLYEKIGVTIYPVVEKGVVTLNFKYKDLFTYNNKGYDSESVDSLVKKGISDPSEIVKKRVNIKFKSIQKPIERFNVILDSNVINEYFV